MAIDKIKIFAPLAVTAAALAAGAPTAHALPETYYAQSSRLASGTHWVKVKVARTGVQRISHEQLRAWGFSDPEKVHVYGFSGLELYDNIFSQAVPDDLPVQYSEHAADALLFYGEGDVRVTLRSTTDIRKRRNNYATYSCYFLSDAEPTEGNREAIPYADNASALLTHTSLDYIEPEEFQPGNASASWFSQQLLPGESRQFTFHATDFTGDAYLTYQPVANTKSRITVSPTIDVTTMDRKTNTVNVTIPTMSTDVTYLLYNSVPNPGFLQVGLKPGYSDFTFTFKGVTNSEWVAIDYACLMYQRRNRLADHGQVAMQWRSIAEGLNVNVSEATSETRVWDVTTPMSVTPFETSFDAETSIASVTTGARDLTHIVAFNPSSENLPMPEYAGTVTAKENLHAEDPDFDMIIISPDLFRQSALRLARLHETYQQMNVKVVSPTDIYNEFSSGAPSAIALRRYVKMLYDRNPGRLKYLLLMGHASSDHRFITLNDDGSYLFTYEVEEDRDLGYTDWSNFSVSNFATDNYFGMLSDNFTIKNIYRQAATIGVGRFTVASPADAEAVVDKVEHYLTHYLTSDEYARTGALGDSGDENAHTLMAEAAVKIMLEHQPDITAHRLYFPLYRNIKTAGALNTAANQNLFKREVQECLSEGVGLFGFSGHSNGTIISGGAVSISMLPNIAFPNRPIFFLATCGELPIDGNERTFGQEIFLNPKAAVAVFGAARTVYLNRNKALFDSFNHRYFDPEAGDCLGDVWRKSFNNIVTNYDQSYGINTLCYNFAGDPALPVAKPTNKAVVRTVNGKQPGTKMAVEATKPIKLSGEITGSNGMIDKDFNGYAVISLYDGTQTVKTVPTASDESIELTVDHHLLARTGAEVTDGVWEATLTPPVGSVSGLTNRLQVWASDGDHKMALGSFSGLSVNDPRSVSASSDTEGPVISEMYIDNPDFTDGGNASSDFTLYARIDADPSGINVSGNTIGNRLTLTLDGGASNSVASNCLKWNTDGSATLAFPYTDVTDGTHSLTLSVCDNAGNMSTRSLSFTVVNGSLTGTLSIDNRIITGKAVIDLNLSSSANVTRVVVDDAAGKTVYKRSIISFPWNWTPDETLPDGNYTVRAYFTDGSRWGATEPLSVILIRNK